MVTLSLICLASCLAQQPRPRLNFTGVITGSLTGDDGTHIGGGYVTLRRLPPHPQRVRQTSWTAVTAAGGAFRFEGLNDGTYQLCAQVPRSTWLNPCEWGAQPPVVVLSAAQGFAVVTLVIKKAAVVPIRLDDPGQLLAQDEGRTPGANLLIGVANDARWFRPAAVTSRDVGGKNYQVLVPFNSTVNIIVSSPFFQLADAGGVPLPRTRATAIPVTVPAGQQPAPIRLRVTGGGGR
ncbi:MAG: carboxypeptidase regulatory-like domain-containing protein [Acidobacteria bacterium]|nr:carboxypeptidase regulatory-like domain-containing protein [Acidobacteriota bacterium]